ncbi:MAG: 3'-5' exonuclease [Planctomycetota bacterium]|jgi:inhibitor of KinA sporulation pathway (predicted exonuclease)
MARYQPLSSHEIPSHILVIDLEATCSDDNRVPREEMEIIEIGAVLASGQQWSPVAEFQTFVQPVRNPELTDFCCELTGITPADIAGAPPFADAMQSLGRWLEEWPEAVFGSWGGYDKRQFQRDCEYHSVDYPFGERHINLKEEFAVRFRLKHGRGLQHVLADQGIEFEGRPHRGIDDARNITRLLPALFPRR